MMREGKPPLTIKRRAKNAWLRLQREWRIKSLNQQVIAHAKPNTSLKHVVFFNASTRLTGFSQNAAFSLLTTWGLQLSGIEISHFVCRAGMVRCVLGTNPDDFSEIPPCEGCISLSKRILRSTNVHWFEYDEDQELNEGLNGLNVEELSSFEWQIDGEKIQLGQMVLPSIRWSLRRHHLEENESTREILKAYLQSAFNVARKFSEFLDDVEPQVVVVFNGIMFPEAAARWAAINRGLRVITHEVGFQPFSVFFTPGHATAYPLDIPDEFELSQEQSEQLDDYLNQRHKGEFTMAGIRFWPKISGLDDEFLERAKQFKQIVPVFTNVINDTSQVHASTVFAHMYDWLYHVLEVIREHEDTFFVIRAHPDEKRIGTHKHSREPVSDWVAVQGLDKLPNVVFVDSNEPLSSYELIQLSKFVIVYNSSIGLEASLLNVPVLCGGKARYTQYPTVFFPQSPLEYQERAREFLAVEKIEIPPEFIRNARRILYWQLFRTSLSFENYLSAHPTPGYVQLKPFDWTELLPENSPTMEVLIEGIINQGSFVNPD